MMKLSPKFAKAILYIGVISLLIAFLSSYLGFDGSGIFVLMSLGLIIVGMSQFPKMRSYIFTMVVFLSAASAMYFPSIFVSVGDYELKKLIVPILMVIMFGMGTSMNLRDFYNVIKMPKGVFVGMLCQFMIMPFVGFGLASISGLAPEIAAGIILVGCSPSGLASNVMSYLAKANLALSLTLTMLATLVAPIVTPLLMELLANQFVPIDFYKMFLSIIKIVILPVITGLIFNYVFRKQKEIMDKIMPLVSMAGIAFVIAIITAIGRDSLLDIGLKLIAIVIIHNIVGYFLGYWIAKLVGLDEASTRTIALEVGMQNSGLASGIAMEMNKIATMGLAPAVFGPFMNITGSSLASFWAGKKEKEVD